VAWRCRHTARRWRTTTAEQRSFAMLRHRAWVASLCGALILLAVLAPSSRGAETVDVSFVPYDAVAAIVLHPRRVLTSPQFEMLPIEVLVAVSTESLGIDPTKVDQAVGILGMTGLPAGQPGLGAVLRFSEAYDQQAVLARAGQGTQEATFAGKKYYKSMQDGGISLYMPDDRTLLLATETAMKGMLKPPSKETPLVKLLKQVDTSKTAVAVLDFATIEPLAMLALETLPPLPPQLEPFIAAHEHLSWVRVSLDLEASPVISVTLGAHNPASAAKLKELAEQAVALGRQFVNAQVAQMAAEGDDATSQAMGKYFHRVANKLLDGVEIQVVDDRVDVVLLKDSPQMATTGMLVALLLPAVQSAREAARRAAATNELKQIGLAMHNHHDKQGKFPAPAIVDKDGKRLLSWRVAILPYLEEQALYDQFHLDEPWDSEHNKKLIPRMPSVYVNPNFAEEGKTLFLGVAGPGQLFEGPEGVTLRQIRDGSSNTIMVVEADPERAVVWTKPDDLEIDRDHPAAGLGGLRPGGFNTLFADGSVRFIGKDIDPQLFLQLLTYAGGEVVAVPR
jgi:prepilin-type processing-associated H-X9-DG protein